MACTDMNPVTGADVLIVAPIFEAVSTKTLTAPTGEVEIKLATTFGIPEKGVLNVTLITSTLLISSKRFSTSAFVSVT